jgi:GNAT superfamily N-acetyltransferase
MPTIRAFRTDDLEALYDISLATGHAGGDASALYDDRKMMGHIYAAPYALLAPERVLIAEDHEGVAGFALGALDTLAWEGRLEREWWPALRRRYAMPDERDAAHWTADQRRAAMIHRPTPVPRAVRERYPAHLHLNLLPRLQGRGLGRTMVERWTDDARRSGASALHAGINHANTGALAFWPKMGFSDIPLEGVPPGRTVWMGRHLRES